MRPAHYIAALGTLYVCRRRAITYVTRLPSLELYMNEQLAHCPEFVARRVAPSLWPTHDARVHRVSFPAFRCSGPLPMYRTLGLG